MATQSEKLIRAANTPGVLGVTYRAARVHGTDDVAFFPSPRHPAPTGLVSMLAETLATLDACGRAGVLVKEGVRIKLDREGYSILVMDGPEGTVSIAFLTGHPVVKSINRPARSITGHRRHGEPRRHPSGTAGPREVPDLGMEPPPPGWVDG